MNSQEQYVEADSTNLPKVDTLTLFGFLKNGRKFSYVESENDKNHLAIDKFGDNSIGYVWILRTPVYCVVKAMMDDDDSNNNSYFPIRTMIDEKKNIIVKLECKKCLPAECIHGFALLMWLHRRSEESVKPVTNYCQKPGSIVYKLTEQDRIENNLLTPKSTGASPPTTNYLNNNNNYSPEMKLFLHGRGISTSISTQTSTYSNQLSQTSSAVSQTSSSTFTQQSLSQQNNTVYSSQHSQVVQYSSQRTSQESSLIREPLTQITTTQYAISPKQQRNVRTMPYSPKSASPQKQVLKSTQVSQMLYTGDLHASQESWPKSSSVQGYSPLSISKIAVRSDLKTVFPRKFIAAPKHSKVVNPGLVISRDYCENENTVSTQQPQSQDKVPQITNTEPQMSPKPQKAVRAVPYSPKPIKGTTPTTHKKQSLLSKKVSQLVKQPKIDNFFVRPKIDEEDCKPQIKNLYMCQLVKNFLKLNKGTIEDFMAFAGKQMTEFLCNEAEKLTRIQRTDLWMELRYGRITASVVNEAANCRTLKGSLANKIMGKAGRYQTPAMKRGIDLEDKILKEVQTQLDITTKSSGLFLSPKCPIIGASPDAIGSDFIVEIKAPSTDNTFETFLPKGEISKKCKSQMYLQMYCTGMAKGLFCVADPNFERNKKVTTVWLDYNDEEFNPILEKAKMFWCDAIFPQLVNA